MNTKRTISYLTDEYLKCKIAQKELELINKINGYNTVTILKTPFGYGINNHLNNYLLSLITMDR